MRKARKWNVLSKEKIIHARLSKEQVRNKWETEQERKDFGNHDSRNREKERTILVNNLDFGGPVDPFSVIREVSAIVADRKTFACTHGVPSMGPTLSPSKPTVWISNTLCGLIDRYKLQVTVGTDPEVWSSSDSPEAWRCVLDKSNI